MKCPCKGCENRHLKCHSKCESYIEWAAYDKKQKEMARAQKQYDYSENYYLPSRRGKRKIGSR